MEFSPYFCDFARSGKPFFRSPFASSNMCAAGSNTNNHEEVSKITKKTATWARARARTGWQSRAAAITANDVLTTSASPSFSRRRPFCARALSSVMKKSAPKLAVYVFCVARLCRTRNEGGLCSDIGDGARELRNRKRKAVTV